MRTELTVGLLSCLASVASAATPAEQVGAAGKGGKQTYVVFYRSDDDRTRTMADTVEEFASQRPDTVAWFKVQVDRPAAKTLVDRFNASRLPLPAVFALAPNGAVTLLRKQKVDVAELDRGIVTPKCASMVRSLQNQKITVVCLHPAGTTDVPAGVRALARDRTLGPQLAFVSAMADDPAEERFFARMRIERDIDATVVLLFAPPGAYVGTYSANVSSGTLAKAIHGSGKCNCEKCRHRR